jgi:hypothetical protein
VSGWSAWCRLAAGGEHLLAWSVMGLRQRRLARRLAHVLRGDKTHLCRDLASPVAVLLGLSTVGVQGMGRWLRGGHADRQT